MKSIALLLALVAGGCTHASDLSQIGAVALRIEMANGGSCSATAVGPNTLVTAAHCFGGDDSLAAINDATAKALHIERDGNDHALVKVDVTFQHWAQLGPRPNQGDRVTLLGNPKAFRGVYRDGHFAASNLTNCLGMETIKPRLKCEIWLFQMPVGDGDSGAGYFDAKGRLVAVHSASAPIGAAGLDWYQALPVALPLAFKLEQWKAAGV